MKKLRFILVIFLLVASFIYSQDKNMLYDEKLLITINEITTDVIAKNTLQDQRRKDAYSVKNLFDQNVQTAWVTKSNIGSEIRIMFKTPRYLKSLIIYNGYQKSQDLYFANARIKKLVIEKIIIGGNEYPLDNIFVLEDKLGNQEISLLNEWTNTINLFKVEGLIISFMDIYEGIKYSDVCISDIELRFSKEIPYTPSVSWQTLKGLITKNRSETLNAGDWDWNGLSDDNYRLFNDLIYYVLTEEKEAYKIYLTYRPMDAGQSMAVDNIYNRAIKTSLGKAH